MGVCTTGFIEIIVIIVSIAFLDVVVTVDIFAELVVVFMDAFVFIVLTVVVDGVSVEVWVVSMAVLVVWSSVTSLLMSSFVNLRSPRFLIGAYASLQFKD